MKYLELITVYLVIVGTMLGTGLIFKDSNKATNGIKKHLIERGLR